MKQCWYYIDYVFSMVFSRLNYFVIFGPGKLFNANFSVFLTKPSETVLFILLIFLSDFSFSLHFIFVYVFPLHDTN